MKITALDLCRHKTHVEAEYCHIFIFAYVKFVSKLHLVCLESIVSATKLDF